MFARVSTSTESFLEFFELVGRLDRDRFLEAFPHPFLLTEANTDPHTWRRARIARVAKRVESGKIAIAADGSALDDLEQALAATRIVVGREPGCDVVLPVGTVSKRHAYLSRRGDRWSLTDLRSANGTTLDGSPCEPQRAQRIRQSPARIAFGPDVRFNFFTPEALYEFLERIRGVHGIAASPPRGHAPARPADLRDFACLADRHEVEEDEVFSRVVALSRRSSEPPTPKSSRPPGATTELNPGRAGGDDRFRDLLAALDDVGTLVGGIEVELDGRPGRFELFRDGSPDELMLARARLVSLRQRIVSVRLTPATADRTPYDVDVRRLAPGDPAAAPES